MKKGGRWSRWKRRFCVLHTRYFVWHEEERHNIATLLFDPEDSEATGRFPVSDMKAELEGTELCLTPQRGKYSGQQYRFKACISHDSGIAGHPAKLGGPMAESGMDKSAAKGSMDQWYAAALGVSKRYAWLSQLWSWCSKES